MSKRDQFEIIKQCFLYIWDSWDRAQHYSKKDRPLWEELVPCKERNVINDPLVDRDRILFLPLHIKIGLHQGSGQGWWLLHLLVPGVSRIDHGEVESWNLWQSSDPAAHQTFRVRKLNERSGTGSMEGICSGSEELYWPETTQNLSTTFWLLSETWVATWASRCTSYFHIWTCFRETWVQWVTSRGRDSIRTWKR